MLLGVGRSAELFELTVVLGQLQRTLHVKEAADFKERFLDIAVFNVHGLALVDPVIADDAAPKAVFLHDDAPCLGAKTAL